MTNNRGNKYCLESFVTELCGKHYLDMLWSRTCSETTMLQIGFDDIIETTVHFR